MKKFLLLTATVLAVLFAIVAFSAAPLFRWYLNNNGPSLIGRQIHVDDASVNLLTGRVEAESMVIFEADGEGHFLEVPRLITRVSLFHLLSGTYSLNGLELIQPRLEIEQRDTLFNFSDIITHLMADTSPDDPPFPLVISGMQIRGGHIHYRDALVKSDFRLDHFSLFIPGIDLREINTSVGMSFDLTEGGRLITNFAFDDRAKTFCFDMILQGLPLESLLPYVRQSIDLGDLQGNLDLELFVNGSSAHLMKSQMQGQAQITKLELLDPDDEPLLMCDSVSLGIRNIDLMHNRFDLSHLRFNQPFIRIDYGKDSLDCYSRLMVQAAEENTPSSELEADTATVLTFNDRERPFRLTVDKLQVRDASFSYRDESLQAEPFVYLLSQVNLSAPHFTLDGVNHITANARFGQRGTFNFRYDGRIDNLHNMHATVEASQIDVTDFSPYTVQMFGNEISSGTLSANLLIDTQNGQLNSFNRIVVTDPKVEKKRRDVTPEMNIPFRAGMYILTDRNDVCDIELPVKGNIDDPKFSYKRLLFRTLGKLVVKVCTSPFRRSSSTGTVTVDAASLDSISLDNVQPELLNEE